MTTIAWDGQYLAGDGRSTCGDFVRGVRCPKVQLYYPSLRMRWMDLDVTGEAVAWGCCGNRSQGDMYSEWMHRVAGDAEAEWPFPTGKDEWDTEALEIRMEITHSRDGQMTSRVISVLGREPNGVLCQTADVGQTDYKWGGGTGANLAEGAMLAGASAMEAVKIACSRDINSGGQITFVDTLAPWRGVQVYAG